ncbi:secreted protein [gut metagenome]|uniref:Secreted protein n=1 Tax=gut metagenome TaxID=749906 RepID=J9GMV2_9ZZZZ
MKNSSGFLLMQDMIIYLLCSLLLLSAGSAYKMALVKQQHYRSLSDGCARLEAYLLGEGTDIGISSLRSITQAGTLVELQLWEDGSREKMVCNIFLVKQ